MKFFSASLRLSGKIQFPIPMLHKLKHPRLLNYCLPLLLILASCADTSKNIITSYSVSNPHDFDYSGLITIEKNKIENLTQDQTFAVYHEETPLATQWSDSNGDGLIDVFCIEVNVKAKSEIQLSFIEVTEDDSLDFKVKTQAELWHKTTGNFKDGRYYGGGNFSKFDSLRVPDGFTDHAYFIKYEGPGWESDKVGYRLYLDWRNAIDVFGKKVDEPVLQGIGLDGYQSYHQMQDWGMDVLKVGKSLGIGSTAWWDGEKAVRVETTDSVICRIAASGPIRSQVEIDYYGWQTNGFKAHLNSLKTIDVGSRMTRECLSFDKAVSNICTGIRKEPRAELIHLSGDNKQWACMATWGKQSLNNDNLGLAIIFPLEQNPIMTEDANSHLVVFEKALKNVEYYFLAAWELEKGGLTSKEAFITYLKQQLKQLEQPLGALTFSETE